MAGQCRDCKRVVLMGYPIGEAIETPMLVAQVLCLPCQDARRRRRQGLPSPSESAITQPAIKVIGQKLKDNH